MYMWSGSICCADLYVLVRGKYHKVSIRKENWEVGKESGVICAKEGKWDDQGPLETPVSGSRFVLDHME